MFYNSIRLHEDHWKYQKMLINPDLDPDSEALVAVIVILVSKNDKVTDRIIWETTEVLQSINMKVKGWARSGADPPEELSDNGVSVSFAGMTWFPHLDVYKLNIDSLHFSKKH